IVFTFSICNTSAQGKFPESWIGNYEGEMKIGYYDKPGMLTQVKYSLQEIIKDSVWSHKMIFNSEQYGKVIKDYVIRASKRGDHVNFILDELNGVEMEMSFMNDCFYSFFMLNESSYTTTFRRLSDGSLLWDLYVTPHGTKKVDVIASGEGEQKRTFEVSSFKPSLHQTVIFRKKN
ncbi:MAG: hypothetical protein AAFX87_29975, partial [Bacteroidota bacterium]